MAQNRVVVNVATAGSRYIKGQERLLEGLEKYDPTCSVVTYQTMPLGCPTHEEKPYAFKAYALRKCYNTHQWDLALWADASIIPIRDMAPLWEKIRKDGYWIARNGWNNYEWTADSAYPDLFPGVDLDEARFLNKKIQHVVATAFGLNFNHPIGDAILHEYYRLASETNAFCGPWRNSARSGPRAAVVEPPPCGPSDVLGHRHDQTALSIAAYSCGAELTDCPEFFAYWSENPDPRTILCAKGC